MWRDSESIHWWLWNLIPAQNTYVDDKQWARAAVVEWLSSWLAEQWVKWGLILGLVSWIWEIGDLLLPSRNMTERLFIKRSKLSKLPYRPNLLCDRIHAYVGLRELKRSGSWPPPFIMLRRIGTPSPFILVLRACHDISSAKTIYPSMVAGWNLDHLLREMHPSPFTLVSRCLGKPPPPPRLLPKTTDVTWCFNIEYFYY